MPPKVKVTKESILHAAVELVREGGEHSLNARAIAARLGCSTQPVFSNYATMEELQAATVAAAYQRYLDFLQAEAEQGKYPRYKAFGMAYIGFAKAEPRLFKLLFMRDRTGEDLSLPPDFEESVGMIMQTNDVTREKAMLMHLELWACVHGLGVMAATSFLSLEWDLISQMLSDVYQGIRSRNAGKEDSYERHQD